MIGEDFCYDGQWLSSYTMKMYDPDNEQAFVDREIDRSEFTSIRSTPNHFSTHYAESLILEFFIIRDVEKYDYHELALSGDDIHELRSWLESAKTPKELIVPEQYDDKNTHYFGIFTSVQPFIVGCTCYGLKLIFTCNSPYGFSDIITSSFAINGSSNAVANRIYNGSAEKTEYMMPTIIINSSSIFGSSESVAITNETDGGKIMNISLPRGLTKLIIDCSKKIITDGSGNLIPLSNIGVGLPNTDYYSFISADHYMFYWLRLLPDFNNISISASSGNTITTIDISGRYIMKSGGF